MAKKKALFMKIQIIVLYSNLKNESKEGRKGRCIPQSCWNDRLETEVSPTVASTPFPLRGCWAQLEEGC